MDLDRNHPMTPCVSYLVCWRRHRHTAFAALVLLGAMSYWVGCGTFDASKRGQPGSRAGETRYFAGMPFVWCPPGTFTMGKTPDEPSTPEYWPPNSERQHQVRLTRGFWFGKFEVTQSQWRAVMGGNPSRFTGDHRLPVDSVSWEDCQDFLVKLYYRTRMRFRLPTDAEWEYACRAGTAAIYYFGNDNRQLEKFAWFTMNSGDRTHRVGTKPPNAWGLYNMHGNVAEWCLDFYGQMGSADVVDPTGRAAGHARVLRSGSWGASADYCRSAFRACCEPDVRNSALGFRIVCEGNKEPYS